jgi:hypothetical protein
MTEKWFPEVLYEEIEDGVASKIPFVIVPEGEEMPPVFFMWEYRHTGRTEPDHDGNESPVVEADLMQFARMDILKENLSSELYDQVRDALGLEPLATAAKKGHELSANVAKNIAEK